MRKSNMPSQRPSQVPRWIGSFGGLAMLATKSGFASSALVVTVIHACHGRVWSSWSSTEEPGKVIATLPGSPATRIGKLTSCTPGGAI